MKPIRTMIVDDERLARNRLRRLLEANPDFEVVAECANGVETLNYLRENEADLMFLDVQMPEMDGFALLEQMQELRAPLTVFVTAYDEYAVKAFDVHAVDYLLKPFDQARFDVTLDRIREALGHDQQAALNRRLMDLLEDLKANRNYAGRFAVRSGGRVRLVRVEDVDWIEAADNYVCLHIGAESHLLRETMNSIESQLDPNRFLRIHRSAIVNVDRVKELQPLFRGDCTVILLDGQELTLSRNYRDKLQRILGRQV